MVREKSGNFDRLSKHGSLPLLSFNLVISVSAKTLYQELMKNFLKSLKMKVGKKWSPCLRASIFLGKILSPPIFLMMTKILS